MVDVPRSPTAQDLGIERTTRTRKITVAMPRGGFKNARVIEKKITLPRLRFLDDPEEEAPPRNGRRK